MEAVKQWGETEEPAMALRGRLPRQHSITDTSTTIITGSGNFVFSSETSPASSEDESLNQKEAEEVKESTRNGNFVSDKIGGTDSHPYGISGFSGENVDFLTSKKSPGDERVDAKVEILSFQKTVVTKHQDEGDMKGAELPGFAYSSSKQSIEQIEHYTEVNNGTTEHERVNLREISEQEVSELYLERVYQKPAAHEFYCPNCKSCITKVIIRGRELKITPPIAPPPPPPVDPIRCTSCFSFLIPIGNWFFPKKDEEDTTEQGTNIEPVPNEPVEISAAAIAKPTIPAQASGVEISVPSHELSEPLYGQKPTVPGQLVEAIVGDSGTAKPSGNDFEGSVGVQVSVSSHDSNGTLLNQKPHVPGQSVDISVLVTRKPPASESDVVSISPDAPQLNENDAGPAETERPDSTTVIITREPEIIPAPGPGDTKTVEIIKSIVYGGLTEAITSLGIVTSAASADTATLNILALALANLVGGLFIIGHSLWELKDDDSKVPSSETEEQVDKYQKVLGKKENFFLHAPVAILSFIIFGLVPPLVYGFSFRQSNDRDLKIAAVGIASLLCLIILAIGKAYIQRPKKYIKTVLYYISFGIGVAGLSFLAGDLIDKLIEKLGWFSSDVSGTLLLPQMGMVKPALEFY